MASGLLIVAPRRAVAPPVVWRGVHAAADGLVAGAVRAILGAIGALKAAVPLTQLAYDLLTRNRVAVERDLGLDRIGPALAPVLADKLIRATVAGADAARPTVELRVDFGRVNEAAVAWASQHAASRVVELSDESRHALRQAIAQGYRDGIGADKLAGQLRDVIGLTDRQAAAVGRLRATMLAGKMAPARAEDIAAKYARRLLRQRADTIARTELMMAACEGQRILWQQARADGSFDNSWERFWIITDDKRACAQCLAMRGATAPIGGLYRDGTTGPPRHPLCRCAEGIRQCAGVGVA